MRSGGGVGVDQGTECGQAEAEDNGLFDGPRVVPGTKGV